MLGLVLVRVSVSVRGRVSEKVGTVGTATSPPGERECMRVCI